MITLLAAIPSSHAADLESIAGLEHLWPNCDACWPAGARYASCSMLDVIGDYSVRWSPGKMVAFAGGSGLYLAEHLWSQEGQSFLSLRWLVAIEAALTAIFLRYRRCGQLWRFPLHLLPRSAVPRVIGRIMVARTNPKPSSPALTWAPTVNLSGTVKRTISSSPAASVGPLPATVAHASASGIALHLSARPNGTGYKGVTFIASRRSRPYRARAPGGALIGDFSSSIEAAEHYSRHVGPPTRGVSDEPSTFKGPDGEIIDLHMAPGSPTGYRGVSLLAERNLAKPFTARIGPAAVDFVGYYASALEAAVAVVGALRARESVLGSMSALDFSHDLGSARSQPSELPRASELSGATQPPESPASHAPPAPPLLSARDFAAEELSVLTALSDCHTPDASKNLPDDLLAGLGVDSLWPDHGNLI